MQKRDLQLPSSRAEITAIESAQKKVALDRAKKTHYYKDKREKLERAWGAEGEEGLMVITPLFTNNSTAFLRWSSGDIVRIHHQSGLTGPFSVFPVMQHAHRTGGFFKVRGKNINHTEFEDFMFRIAEVNDFKVEPRNNSGSDIFATGIETQRGSDVPHVSKCLETRVREAFKIRPEIKILENGTLAIDFEASVKAPRFRDNRS